MELFPAILAKNTWIVVLLAIWAIPWKGAALWRADRLGQKVWFIVLLIVNTLAILDILYIFIFSKRGSSAEKNYQ